MKPRYTIALAILCALAGAAHAESGPHSDPEPESKWEFSITPYVWLPGIDGELGFEDASSIEVNDSQLTSLLNVNYFGFLAGEVRRDRWLVMADSMLLNITFEPKGNPRTIEFPGASFSQSFEKQKTFNVGGANHEIGPIDFSGDVNVDVSGFDVSVGPLDVELNLNLILAQLMGGYRVFDVPVAGVFGGPVADDDHRRLTFDVFGGARYINVKAWANVGIPPTERSSFDVSASADLSVSGGGQPIGNLPINTPEFRKDRSVDFGTVTVPPGTPLSGGKYLAAVKVWWVDPVVGLRVRGGITQNTYWIVSGDIGGFGIGSASKLTWQAVGGLGWHFGESWSAELSMRALEIDRESANTTVRLLLWGPQLGLTYRF